MMSIETEPSPKVPSPYRTFFIYVFLLLTIGIIVGYASVYFTGASATSFDAKAISPGDTAWVLTASVLVMLIVPAAGLFYGGLVTSRNVVSVISQSLVVLAVISIQWVVVGYSLAFGDDFHGIIGGLNFFALQGVGYAPNLTYAKTIPQLAFMIFQAMGAVIAPTLIIGSIVGRARFRTLVLFVLLWATLVYDPVTHWVWGSGGWLHNLGVLDFAGGSLLHTTAGFSGLAAAILIGKRHDFKVGQPIASHNIPLVLLSAGMIWFGVLGVNGGSAFAASPVAVNAFVAVNTSGAAGALVWMILSWAENEKPSALATATGAMCGLVAMAPASGYVGPMASIAIGTIAGLVTYLALHLRSKYLHIDDTLDVWAVHGVGGVIGVILTGVFAEKVINGAGNNGLFFGNPGQLGIQILAALAALAYSFLMTIILLKILSLLGLGLRVPRHEEEEGLDLAVHGEEGYTLVVPQIQAEERIAPLEVKTADLYQCLQEEQIANLTVENSYLRQSLQEEAAGLYQYRREKRIVNLEVENRELYQRVKVINNKLRVSAFEGGKTAKKE